MCTFMAGHRICPNVTIIAEMEISGYHIDGLIGEGGMSTVYLARQRSPERQVALKTIRQSASQSSEYREQFLREGHLVSELSHPNIVRVYDVGDEAGVLYVAMEYLGGGTLTSRLVGGTPIPPQGALRIAEQVANALAVAHRRDIVHRDVKPSNILFREDGTPVLTDFGIAKRVGESQRTFTGVILGSPGYLSPEQAEQNPRLDGRSDIYSLGIVLYEMLTGHPPYEEESAIGLVLQHLQAPVPVLPDHLSTYQPLLELMLAKERDDRLPNATSLAKCIQALRSPGAGNSAQVLSRYFVAQQTNAGWRHRSGTRRPGLSWTALGLIALLGIAAITYYAAT